MDREDSRRKRRKVAAVQSARLSGFMTNASLSFFQGNQNCFLPDMSGEEGGLAGA